MATVKQLDNEEFEAAQERARGVRATVARQLHDLVIESDRMSGGGDVQRRVELIAGAQRKIREARGRREQARVMGLPIAPTVRDEREGVELLREACMNAAVALAGWAAAIDFAALQASESSGTVDG